MQAETASVEDADNVVKLDQAEVEQEPDEVESPRCVSAPNDALFCQHAACYCPLEVSCSHHVLWCRTESSDKADSSNYDSSAVEVFVGGLPPDTREEQVQQAFSAVGQVISLRLNRRKRTGECKGFGFVRYNDQATAERACAEVQEVHFPAVDHVVSRHGVISWPSCLSHCFQRGSLQLWITTLAFSAEAYVAGLWQASRSAHLQR